MEEKRDITLIANNNAPSKTSERRQQDKDSTTSQCISTTVVVDNKNSSLINVREKVSDYKRSESLEGFTRNNYMMMETENCVQLALLDDCINQNAEEDENGIDNCFEREFSLSEDLLEESNKWIQEIRSQNCYDDKRPPIRKNFGDGQYEIHNGLIQSHTYGFIAPKKTICDDLVVENLDEDIKSLTLKQEHPNKTLEFNDLPDELKIRIFSYFTKRQLCSYVAPVCLSWFQLAKDPLFWTEIYKTDFEAVKSSLLIKVILSWCKQLSCLELDNRSDITEEGFEMIFKYCPQIKHLSLKDCNQVDTETLKLMQRYEKNLQSIDLEGCVNISEQSLYYLVGLPLHSFSIAYCKNIYDEGGIFLIKNFQNLEKINLDGIQWITDDLVKNLVSIHHNTLEKVVLDGENISDESIDLLSTCRNLRVIGLSFCHNLTSKSFDSISKCNLLNELKLRKGKENFTNISVMRYFSGMSEIQGINFKSLNLAECTEITDECLHIISEKCPNLVYLDLSWCWEILDGGITFIINRCSKLKELHLIGLHELYGAPFARIPSRNPDFEFLDLSQCNKIEDDILVSLVRVMPKVVVKNYYGESIIANTYSDDSDFGEF